MNSKEILLNSSVYAVSKIGKSKCVLNKVMWLLILFLAFLGSSYQIYLFMKVYLEYPVIVNLQIDQQERISFPAVTVCNMNRMKFMHAGCLQNPSKCPKPVADEVFVGSIPGNSRQPPLILPERRGINMKKENESKAQLEFLKKYYKLSPYNRNSAGYLRDEVITSCSFNFKSCEFRHSLNMRYGNCYTFNPLNSIFQELLMATSVGPINGLEMTLSVDPEQYLPISHTVGMRIVIHDPSDEPDPEDKGINIAPGYETHISLKETVMRRLPAPYKDKCVFYGGEDEPLVKSRTLCVQACIQEYSFARCGCVDPFFWTMSTYQHCDTSNSTEMNCLDTLMKYLAINETNCQCPLSCLSKHYNEQITRTLWPSKAYFLETNFRKIDEKAFKTYRNSHVRVRIFFSTLERSLYEQKAMFQESEMYGCLGGEFALWLGLSLFAFCELIEVLLFLANHLICDFKERIDLFSIKYWSCGGIGINLHYATECPLTEYWHLKKPASHLIHVWLHYVASNQQSRNEIFNMIGFTLANSQKNAPGSRTVHTRFRLAPLAGVSSGVFSALARRLPSVSFCLPHCSL
ncbi:Amiloride-sensitive sodium channel subunit alpha [Araneus ventricosus]|uniref:Amiloride-sensitive sodium channel subunit alpha n=1 Tax=Araneus ventricosus TaxID=182803 RepID=A0A4Y2LP82_ARAVE|nr:Amiloride-sensitive sodium channel subunit alpha [Araneus ventricosus]